ncbi:MAG: hypothetical protein IPK74_33295 [Deltaproteobacteria bacterium]|nr:hypothetical protein [Deltaproteobacteria bacterium]
MPANVAVAFTIRDPLGVSGEVRGRVGFGGAAVVLELDVQRSATRKIVIDVEEFASCTFRRGMLGARMQLWALDEGALGGVPGASDEGVCLQFSRTDRDAAEALASRVRGAIDDAVAYKGVALWRA